MSRTKAAKPIRTKAAKPSFPVVNPVNNGSRPKKRKAKLVSGTDVRKGAHYATDLIDILSKSLKDAVTGLPYPKVPNFRLPHGKGDPEEAVLLLSDLQIGHESPSTNARIIWTRLRRLAFRFLKIIDLHRNAYPITTLNLIILGDIVHNERIGRTVGLDELEAVLYDQVFAYAVPMLEEFIVTLMPHFKEIRIWTVSGNHGRFDKFHADSTNVDTFIYKVLEARLGNYRRVTWNIQAKSFYQVAKINGHNILVTHGDKIKMWMNMPWYGITTRVSRWVGSLHLDDLHGVVMGHFHTASELDWNGIRIFVNGCFVTDDMWVVGNIGLQSTNAQICFGVHPNRGISWKYVIGLDE